jgi:translation factor GUF1, mitochondrial
MWRNVRTAVAIQLRHRTSFLYSRFIRGYSTKPVDLSEFDPNKIRNFCIIAHIDHGKTTLSDRFIEKTGTIANVSQSSGGVLLLDKLQVEKERGITVKAQTCSMFYQYLDEETNTKKDLLLNLVDTPVGTYSFQ